MNLQIELLQKILKCTEHELLVFLEKYLKSKGYNPKVDGTYIIAEGDIPILLVAHLDTVHMTLPHELYYDQKQKVLWSPQGLGADDRAGVFGIISILESGRRPHICFTTGEESGGIGAFYLTTDFTQHPFKQLNYIIELDRQGTNDSVYYDCENKEFEQYVNSFGFKTAQGIFSDIGIIAPQWHIAAVNLSIGYIQEHSFSERLFIQSMYHTIEKVKRMLDDVQNVQYAYVGSETSLYMLDECDSCGGPAWLTMLTFVQYKTKDGQIIYESECLDCVNKHAHWCKKCGTAFTGPKSNLCYECREKLKEFTM